jgi:CheY-like chemotaxis protein
MKPGRYVRLQVTDTGTGMDTETLSHIFEPFFTTKGLDKGTGLGLATVYGIVKQSGGYVWASSELGQGSVFSVYLPAVTEEVEPRALEAKPEQIMRGSGTILLVEDEAPLRELMREQLEGFGYNVLDAADAERADEIADRHNDIVLLLTDLSLPGIGGLTLAKSLREKKPGLKVLYMSAYADADALRGIQEGGGAFLQKPSTREELAQRLHSLLNSES